LKLFLSLSTQHKTNINKHFEHIRENSWFWIRVKTQFPTETPNLHLEKVLEHAKDIFRDFRYSFEPNKGAELSGFFWAVSATRLAIIELNPAWEDMLEPSLRTPPTSHTH
jgi:hypothetical protein